MEKMQFVIMFCSLITGISAASVVVSKVVTKAVNKTLAPITKKIEQIDKVQCQNYLIDFLADVEAGLPKDSSQWEHAHKVYDHYTNDLHENSYVHAKWERVKNMM